MTLSILVFNSISLWSSSLLPPVSDKNPFPTVVVQWFAWCFRSNALLWKELFRSVSRGLTGFVYVRGFYNVHSMEQKRQHRALCDLSGWCIACLSQDKSISRKHGELVKFQERAYSIPVDKIPSLPQSGISLVVVTVCQFRAAELNRLRQRCTPHVIGNLLWS